MVFVEELSNYNYAISFRGCGPKLYDFEVEDIDAAVKEDIKMLMGEHIKQLECIISYEDVSDARYPTELILFNLSCYVVFKLEAETLKEELINTITEYMERSFIRNIIVE